MKPEKNKKRMDQGSGTPQGRFAHKKAKPSVREGHCPSAPKDFVLRVQKIAKQFSRSKPTEDDYHDR